MKNRFKVFILIISILLITVFVLGETRRPKEQGFISSTASPTITRLFKQTITACEPDGDPLQLVAEQLPTGSSISPMYSIPVEKVIEMSLSNTTGFFSDANRKLRWNGNIPYAGETSSWDIGASEYTPLIPTILIPKYYDPNPLQVTIIDKYIDLTTVQTTRNGSLSNPYKSLSELNTLEAKDLVDNNTVFRIHCTGGRETISSTATSISLIKWRTDDKHWIEIIGDCGGPKWNDSNYTLYTTGAYHLLSIMGEARHVRIKGVQFYKTTSATTYYSHIDISPSAKDIRIDGCFFRGGGSIYTDNSYMIRCGWNAVAAVGRITNCTFIDLLPSTGTPAYICAIWQRDGWTLEVYNNTFANVYRGAVNTNVGATTLINNLFYGGSFLSSGSSYNANSGYNSTNLAAATGSTTDRLNQTFSFANFQLVTTAPKQSTGLDLNLTVNDTGAKDKGKELYNPFKIMSYDTQSYIDCASPQATWYGADITWTPTLTQLGNYSVFLHALDNQGGDDWVTMVINIVGKNRAPQL